MTALKSLVTDMRALVGLFDGWPEDMLEEDEDNEADDGAPTLVQCLPSSLEYLEINRCDEAILGQAQELLDEISTTEHRFTKLEEIVFAFDKKVSKNTIYLQHRSSSVAVDAVFDD